MQPRSPGRTTPIAPRSPRRPRLSFGALVLAAASLLAGLGSPSAPAQSAGANEQDRARSAVRDGRALPLARILSSVRRQFPGRVLDAGLQSDPRGGWRYEVRVLDESGRVTEVTVDATSGRILGVR